MTVVPGDLLLRNGRIWTGDPSKPWAAALAVRSGRVRAVGSDAEVSSAAAGSERVVDLQGRLALPGFIDDHTHFVHGGEHLRSVDLRDAATPVEFGRRVAAHAGGLASGRWVTGGDWDHELWPGARLPTRELVDAATADTPVWVTRLDGHMGLANSAALALAGVTRDTPDPAGGTIVRDGTGQPTGVLKDAAMGLVHRVLPPASPADLDAALEAAMAEAARVGVTSIQDITPWSHFELYRRFRTDRRLSLRIAARTPMDTWERQADLVDEHGAGDSWLKLSGLKAFMDGSLGSTTALFFEPYADEPSTSGLMAADNQPEGSLLERIAAADERGLQCSIHAIGDRANSLLLDYYEEVIATNGPRDRRFRIEHAQHVRPQEVGRFAALDIIVSAQPYHLVDDGRWAERRIGRTRLSTAFPFRSLLDSGARVAFGSDWTVAPLSPLLGVHAAVTRATTDGRHPGGWGPDQKVTVAEALRGYTSTGAYAEFSEREKGSLAPGMLADVVVLSEDVFAIPANDIKDVAVTMTIVDGHVVHES
ncbi:MAG: amidohydrolase [Mycobacteriales bacterium]